MWHAIDTKPGQAFAERLAGELLAELGDASEHASKKFQAKAGKVLQRAERGIEQFLREHRLNWYLRSRSSNAFLWALKDRGCNDAYAEQLTQWFLNRLQR